MARQYQPRDFIRRAPNALLQGYLMELGVGRDVPWQHLVETHIEPVLRAYGSAPEPARHRIDTDFPEIERMGTEGGVRVLIEEGRSPFHNVNLAGVFEGLSGHLEMAFIAFHFPLSTFHFPPPNSTAGKRGEATVVRWIIFSAGVGTTTSHTPRTTQRRD